MAGNTIIDCFTIRRKNNNLYHFTVFNILIVKTFKLVEI